MTRDPLPLFVHWEQTTGEVLDRTLKFPKAVRFTFAGRIDTLTLDILEAIVEACYSSGFRKQESLRTADLSLAKLRVLLRLSHDRRYLDRRGYEHVMRRIDEAGRMLGGWRKQQGGDER